MEDWIPRRFVLGLAVLLVLVAGGPAARGEQADSPMVVKIHADWCGAAEAERLGIRAFFDSYKGRTGTVGVLTADGKPVSVMKGELDVSKYVAALEKAREAPAT
jgi:hypothetical protein